MRKTTILKIVISGLGFDQLIFGWYLIYCSGRIWSLYFIRLRWSQLYIDCCFLFPAIAIFRIKNLPASSFLRLIRLTLNSWWQLISIYFFQWWKIGLPILLGRSYFWCIQETHSEIKVIDRSWFYWKAGRKNFQFMLLGCAKISVLLHFEGLSRYLWAWLW